MLEEKTSKITLTIEESGVKTSISREYNDIIDKEEAIAFLVEALRGAGYQIKNLIEE